jgi:hypothetical protein
MQTWMIPVIHPRIKRLPAAGDELPAVRGASEDLALLRKTNVHALARHQTRQHDFQMASA